MENKHIIEKLAETVVLIDIEDKQAFGNIHNLFEKLAENLDDANLKAVIKNILGHVEQLIMDEADDADQSIEAVSQSISVLQDIISEGKSFDDVNFPDIVSLEGSESSIELNNPDLPGHIEEDIFSEFLSKQENVLQDMEAILLEVEQSDSNDDWRKLKAILHTMKGESAMVGLEKVEKRCHQAEDLIEQDEASGKIDKLFELKDWLEKTFHSYTKGNASDDEEKGKEEIEEEDNTQLDVEEDKKGNSEQPDESEGEAEEDEEFVQEKIEEPELVADFINESMEHIETLDRELLSVESDPTDKDSLNSIFRAFHTIKGVAGFLNLDNIQHLSHVSEDLLDSARKGKIYLDLAIIDFVFEAVDKLKELIEALRSGLNEGLYPPPDPEVDTLIEKLSDLNSERSGSKPKKEAPKKSSESKPKKEKETQSQRSKKEKKKSKKAGDKKVKTPKVRVRETLKIGAERLDRMVDMIGELVIAESMVSQSDEIRKLESLDLDKKLNRLDKITRELQETGLSLRMIPVKSTFHKMARLVRDLSRKSGKPINFVMEGKDTELDKSVVEKIGDPLVHLLRNAVDHGIEPPEEREKAGKDREGTVALRAFHKSGKIYIEVEDDGKGLDAEGIVKKAKEKGIIDSAESLSDREIYNLIFEPGFSTAKKVTDVSGRGVGMDVVRKNIESLRGKIQIQSEKGKGSIFKIQLPLTLAVIDGMVIRLGDERFIIPTLSVITSVQVKNGDVSTITRKGEVIKFQDEMVPIFRLGEFFHIQDTKNELTEGIVVIVESDGKRVGIFTDRLLSQEQIVIKSLSDALKSVPGVAGGTIMPDGKVALILDIGGLVEYSRNGTKVKQEAFK
ncbi:MAG: chemotaxis protein CheA [Candidatus Marinimicrobia bacterium]|nr:chemotaxis protein CheA [Candidatus Neomarinimicrobiota bacterium]